MKVTVFSTIAISLTSWACGADSPNATKEQQLIRLPTSVLDQELYQELGFIRDHGGSPEYAFGYLRTDVISDLPNHIAHIIDVIDEDQFRRGLIDPQTLEIRDELPQGGERPQQAASYHDYEELTAELERLEADYPDLIAVESAGSSTRGRELWYAKISDNAHVDEAEPKLLYIANMHGDETVGRELMVYLIRELLEGYGNDDRLTAMVANAQIFIMPSMNPDGFARGMRWTATGADLNRDFPDFTSDPRDTLAGREPETQAVMRLHDQHHFITALNYHGGTMCVNIPWDTIPNRVESRRFGDDPFMRAAALKYTSTNDRMRNSRQFRNGVTYGYEWYETDGSVQDWSNYYRRSIHATVEMSYTKYPSAQRLAGYWTENRSSLLDFLEMSMVGFHYRVIDGSGNEIDNVEITVSSAPRRTVRYERATINKPAIGNLQSVKFVGPSGEEVELTATPWLFDGSYLDVLLH